MLAGSPAHALAPIFDAPQLAGTAVLSKLLTMLLRMNVALCHQAQDPREPSMSFGRVPEPDIVIPALRAAAASPGGEITTTALIAKMVDLFQPQGEDAELIEGRADTKFTQKVRNLISHRSGPTSMFSKGYATYHAASESIRVTDQGRQFLSQVPGE